MTLEMLAAKNGDCLILRCGTTTAPALILIDGGPAGVWNASLKPRLMEIRAELALTDAEPLTIDLLVISHVDDDHINGVVALLEFIKQRRDDKLPPLFRIKRIWHNSFDNILGNDETLVVMRNQFGPASLGGDIDAALDACEAGSCRDATFVLASIEQGDNVRRLAGALGIPLNPDFGGKLIQVQADGAVDPVTVGGLEITVIGPLHDDLAALQASHDRWLKDHPERQADATALFAALDDTSIANLSSIILIVRSGDRTLLLTGDARADKVLAGLEATGLIAAGATFDLDILKMPHHGSIRNIDASTIKRLPAKSYAFSGNGKFGNPDRETFDLLFAQRPGATMSLVLSYELEEIDKERQADRKRARQKRPGTPAWDETKDALGTILAPPPTGVTLIESSGRFVAIDF